MINRQWRTGISYDRCSNASSSQNLFLNLEDPVAEDAVFEKGEPMTAFDFSETYPSVISEETDNSNLAVIGSRLALSMATIVKSTEESTKQLDEVALPKKERVEIDPRR
jgi:hypothetical protein